MSLAIDEAWRYQGLTYPNPAVGCCVVGEHGEILSVEAHHKAGSSHAEVNALQVAFASLTKSDEILFLKSSHDIHNFLIKNHNNIFNNCTLYVTLEPCSHVGKTPSCANLIKGMGIKKVYISQKDTNNIAQNGADILKSSNIDVEFDICEKEGFDLLEPFKRWSEDRFVLFKWAQRLDGTIDGGTITTTESRVNVHEMRSCADLLVIGGNTVRVDRPTLDARLIDGKAPDVLIYSNSKEIDESLPLFSVENRKVFIENSLEKIYSYKNIYIEGGSSMFEATKDIVDYYLTYIAPSCGGEMKFSKEAHKFEFVHVSKNRDDLVIYSKLIS
jgi:diaminohydroxyphosphoribosylaminopyrimidine deaminase/5-amino-6-(5-phosphoribosylamino)uracil reductase